MTINPTPENPDYQQHLLVEIQQRILSAQYAALKAVNQELIALYWDIGRSIINQQQTASWGKAIVEQFASDIRTEFPGISGFSARNVSNIRHFLQPKPISATIGGRNWLDAQSGDPRKVQRRPSARVYLRMTCH
jgi:hypothetical protein